MSSKRRLRRNTCRGKVRHIDQPTAMAAIRSLRRARSVGYMNAYHCPFCSGWHIGHARKERW